MSAPRFAARVELPASADDAFAWHLRPGALQRLTPSWERATLVSSEGVREGGRIELSVAVGPLRRRFVARHRDVVPGRGFSDEQLEGPFRRFVHRRAFAPLRPDRCALTDEIEYELPLGALGRLVAGRAVRRRLERVFAYRHAVLADDLRRHAELAGPPLRVAISGAGGLIGAALCALLTTGGHEVRRLVRRPGRDGEIEWDPAAGTIDAASLRGLDAVVHLGGESLGGGRWSAARKARLVDSRVRGTALLAETLARLEGGPRILVVASAIGWYGPRREPVDEASPPGEGFLAELCGAWEDAAEPARAAGLRVAHARFGLVLAAHGGALRQLVPVFRAGLGGRVGDGTQGMSWVALDDAAAALYAMIRRPELAGPFDVTAPAPVSNATFARALGRVLRRPAVLPLPAAAVRLLLGEMGQALLLDGAFVLPGRLEAAGHRFAYRDLEGALRHVLGATRAPRASIVE